MSVTARAFFYFQQIEQLVRWRLEECLQPDGITAGQYMVMNLIIHHEPVSSADLARRANMTAQSMGEFIKNLDSKQFITRTTDPTNRRVIKVRLTPEGRNLMVRCESKVDQAERDFFDCLNGEEIAQMRFLLSRVRSTQLTRRSE